MDFKLLKRKIYNLSHPVLGHILMLHRVTDQRSSNPNQRELEITPFFLENTIKKYIKQGKRFLSIDEACSIIKSGKRQKQPFVCLTFDDGYCDNYTIAYPILKRLGVPFTIYVTTGFIDNRLPMWWYSNQQFGLSFNELVALDREPLCTIGAHTFCHPKLDTLSYEEQEKEIINSKTTLEQWLGHTIHHFSYPHGAYNDTTLQIVKECGFTSCLRAWGGTIRRGDISMLELPRIVLKEDE